jgi:glycosyltransferase involved in cell wall biosynthesis
VPGGSDGQLTRRWCRKPLLHVLFLNTRDGLGADVSVHISLARTLGGQGTRVSVATSAYEAPGDSARAAFASIPGLPLMTLELGRPLSGARRLGRIAAAARNVRGAATLVPLGWWCRHHRVDVIHVTDRPRDALFGLVLARLAGSRCLVHAHTNYHRNDRHRLFDWTLRRVDAVVGVSRFTANTYVGAGGIPSSRVFAVHNAVDGTTFRPAVFGTERRSMRTRLGIPPDVPLMGCVARLSRWKDQATLLGALATVRSTIQDAHLILAGYTADSAPDGHGDYQDYLRRCIGALQLDGAVTFAGVLSHREMPTFYAALDVLVHPAIEEPFGLAIVEAMACARPVVAAGSGGVPEIVRDGIDGLLVPPGDAVSMAEAIVTILRDQSLASRLADSARTRVCTTFTPGLQAAAMIEVYGRVAGVQARVRRKGVAPDSLVRRDVNFEAMHGRQEGRPGKGRTW